MSREKQNLDLCIGQFNQCLGQHVLQLRQPTLSWVVKPTNCQPFPKMAPLLMTGGLLLMIIIIIYFLLKTVTLSPSPPEDQLHVNKWNLFCDLEPLFLPSLGYRVSHSVFQSWTPDWITQRWRSGQHGRRKKQRAKRRPIHLLKLQQ